jgi:urease accessory protein
MNLLVTRSLTLLALLCMPLFAQAHPEHAHVGGLALGLSHPIGGLDHLLAMLAVGLWASQLGGSARWLMPVLFVAFMLVGAGLGMNGFALPMVEQGIVASVVVLGLLLLWARRLPLAAGATLVTAFAMMHGLAHGAEMPVSSNAMLYMAGFAVSTALLHLAGMGVGAWRTGMLSRFIGAAIAVAGVGLALT